MGKKIGGRRGRSQRKGRIIVGEFSIDLVQTQGDDKISTTVIYNPTGEKGKPVDLLEGNVNFIKKELSKGRIHTDLVDMPDLFLEEYERAIEKDNEFRVAQGRKPTQAKIIRPRERPEDSKYYTVEIEGKPVRYKKRAFKDE